MRRLLILVAALALLTTACKIEVNAVFTINADKSGEVTLEIGYDDEVADLAAAQGTDPAEMFSEIDLESMPGAEMTEERRGDLNFRIIKVPIDDLTTAQGLGGDMTQGLADSFQISFTDDRVVVQGSTTLNDALGGDTGDLSGFSPEMMAEFFTINIRITMPGKILDHNATSVDGNTLTWAVDLAAPTLDIYAESNPNESPGGSSVLWYVLIAAGVVVLGLLFWLWTRSRSGGGGGGAAAPAAPPAPTAGDVSPPPPPPAE
jgi:hypothetical protein